MYIDMKICVYAITKNESKFVDRWMDSMSEADYVVVLDTGSTDDTVERLNARGAVITYKEISPWRFDTARNESMKLIPTDADICVCTDLDEVFDPGWADVLRASWKPDTEKGKYQYSWNHDEAGNPMIQIWYEKIHSNSDQWYWSMPVHEALTHRTKKDHELNMVYLPEDTFHLHHYPDLSKSRGQYLELMELGIRENANDVMMQWYYGRELYYHSRYDDAIRQLEYVRGIDFPAGYHYQKSAAMVFLGHTYKATQHYDKAEGAYIYAASLVDDVREPLLFLTHLYYERNMWYACIGAGLCALDIPYKKGAWYEDRRNYRDKPHDYLSIAYWNIGDKQKGRYHIEKALAYEPKDMRLLHNSTYFGV
jgi:glycosyltransferase involved in cell wall biosynthesis